MSKQGIADAIAVAARQQAFEGRLQSGDVACIDALAASLFSRYPTGQPSAPPPAVPHDNSLTRNICVELVGQEAIVCEWYLDNAKPPRGTWGVGVTNQSGHKVDRYKDNPQTIEQCLAVYVWLLRNAYIPDVLKAFKGHALTEAQFAAALSFHYNTGAILKTEWVPDWLAGNPHAARTFLETHYLNGGALKGRRMEEAALFFDGKWEHLDGMAIVYPVKKPSYTPDWAHARKVDIRADMDKALAA